MTAGPELRGQRVVLGLVIAEQVSTCGGSCVRLRCGCAGVTRPRPRSGPLTTRPLPGSSSCWMDRSVEWCSTERRSRRTGTSIDIFLDPVVHGQGVGRDATLIPLPRA
jgi:hypothetical protein